MNNIVLFENERVDNLYPFSINHCSWEIRCGCLLLFEKYKILQPKARLSFHGRQKWVDSFLKRFEITENLIEYSDTVFLSGNMIADSSFWTMVAESAATRESFLITSKSVPVGFYLKSSNNTISSYIERNNKINLNDNEFSDFEKIEFDSLIQLEYIWDAVFFNGEQINEDAKLTKHFHSLFLSDHHGIFALNPTNIHVGKNVKISPSVVIDATNGMVVLSDNVRIMPQSTIIGPCYIGKNTTIKIGAKIYGDNSIGEWCKVGGELENSIIHAYSNKQHEGFLGHSYIGEWVNLGADTNNSDLKNTYGEITMILPDKEVKTGRIFLGLMCGDHTKSGINSMFTTGTVAGVCGILVKEWFMPNHIKSFSWGGKQNSPVYKFEKAVETARLVMARRNKVMLDEEIELLKEEYLRILQ